MERSNKMIEEKKILPDEIELSEIVLAKTNHAFEKIRQEDTDNMKNKNTKNKKILKPQAAAIAGVCLLAVSSISVAAAINHYWGRGMNGNLQATDSQQQELTDNGMAVVYPESEDYSSMKITQNGVTVAPNTVIVDDRFAYLSFTISGYNVEEGQEPDFEEVDVSSKDVELNMNGGMYDGIVPDEKGTPVYEDGKPLEFGENGDLISHYVDENGNIEYVIQAYVSDEKNSILGKTIDVDFHNLGTVYKADFAKALDGTWNFEIKLPDVSSSKNFEINKNIEGTEFTIESIEMSPISIKANYSITNAPEDSEDEFGIPQVQGVILKDGTKIAYLTDGGITGYTDETQQKAINVFGFDRVIDVEQVQSLLILTGYESEPVVVEIQR